MPTAEQTQAVFYTTFYCITLLTALSSVTAVCYNVMFHKVQKTKEI